MIRSIRHLRAAFEKGTFLHAVAIIAGGTAFGQSLTVISAPAITRLYRPEDIGLLGVFASLVSVNAAVSSMRYELAIPLEDDDSAAANLLGICFAILLLAVGVSSAALFITAPIILNQLNAISLRPYLWVFPITLLGAGAYQILNFWALRRSEFRALARTKLEQSIAQVASQILLGLLSSGPIGLILGDGIGRSTGASTLLRQMWRREAAHIGSISWQRMRVLAKRYWRFPAFSSGATLVNRVAGQVPILFFAAFFGTQATGYLALTQRVIALPLALVGTSVAQVYFSRMADLIRSDAQTLESLFFSVTRRLLILGVAPTVVVVVLGPNLFSLIFGYEWTEAGLYARLMGLMFLMQFVVVPVSQTLNAMGLQGLQFGWDILRLITSISAILLPHLVGWSASTAVGLYGASMSILYGVHLGLCHHAITRRLHPNKAELGPDPSMMCE